MKDHLLKTMAALKQKLTNKTVVEKKFIKRPRKGVSNKHVTEKVDVSRNTVSTWMKNK